MAELDDIHQGPPFHQSRMMGTIGPVLQEAAVIGGYLALFIALDLTASALATSLWVSPWYFPPGLSLALLLGRGLRYAPALVVGWLISFFWIWDLPLAPLELVVLALIPSLGYTLGAALLRIRLRISPHLRDLRDVGWFVLLALTTPLAVGAVSAAVLAALGVISWFTYPRVLLEWWVSDTIGIVVLTPFLLISAIRWAGGFYRDAQASKPRATERTLTGWPLPSTWEALEILGQTVSIVLALWLAFGWRPAAELHLLYLTLFPLIWIALRNGLPRAIYGILATNMGAMVAARIFELERGRVTELQVLMLTLSLTGLFLGTVVSGRKRAERALRESEERFRLAFEDGPMGMAIAGPDYKFLKANKAFCEIVGYSEQELMGRTFMEISHPGDIEKDVHLTEQVFQGKIPGYHLEKRYITKKGAVQWVQMAATVIRDGQANPRYRFTMVENITERRRLAKEVLEVSEREQRRIGQNLHDGLGQQLLGIAFKCKVLANKLAERASAEAADAAGIAQLTNQAIVLARDLAKDLCPVQLEAGGLVVALRELADNVTDRFNIRCLFSNDGVASFRDKSVAAHLYYIAQEAINNAVKHGHARQILIGLTAAKTQITLTVKDDGVGLPEVLHPTAGIGLHIMQYRARMIDASLAIQRDPSGGTLVSCSLQDPDHHERIRKGEPDGEGIGA